MSSELYGGSADRPGRGDRPREGDAPEQFDRDITPVPAYAGLGSEGISRDEAYAEAERADAARDRRGDGLGDRDPDAPEPNSRTKVAEAAKADEPYGVTEQNMYLFLSRCALGFEEFPVVFADIFTTTEAMLTAPFFLAMDMLAGFGPKDKTIWEFLDVIEDAYEKAWLLDLNLFPALMVRARMMKDNPGTA